MTKRKASRELALIVFSQLSKTVKKPEDINIVDIIQKASEALTEEAENNLNLGVEELIKIRDFIQNHEFEHPENLDKSFNTATIPVKIPLTSDMTGRIDMLLDAADMTYSAIELTKLVSCKELDKVKNYAIRLIKTFIENREKIDAQIKKHSKGWSVERLVKMDRDILRIAITEILCFEDVPISVSINEAVELAKKYSCNESSKFINGILGQVAQTKEVSCQETDKNV